MERLNVVILLKERSCIPWQAITAPALLDLFIGVTAVQLSVSGQYFSTEFKDVTLS